MNAKEKRDKEFYNLNPGEREQIRDFQGGKDPITGEPLKPNANCDHDHTTGLIRGLLNPMTNKKLNDNLQQAMRIVEYLTNPPAIAALGEKVYGLIGKAKRKKKMRYGPHGTDRPAIRSGASVVTPDGAHRTVEVLEL